MKIILSLISLLCVYAATGNAADFLPRDFALLHYAEDSFQPQWSIGGGFAEAWQRDRPEPQLSHFTPLKNGGIYHAMDKLRKKMTIAFSPKLVLKPVIIVEQLQDLYSTYQSQKQEETVPLDQNVQAGGKAQAKMMPPESAASAKETLDSANFLFSPYYHRVYGIHLQILW